MDHKGHAQNCDEELVDFVSIHRRNQALPEQSARYDDGVTGASVVSGTDTEGGVGIVDDVGIGFCY